MAEQFIEGLNHNLDIMADSVALLNLSRTDACLLNKVGARLRGVLAMAEEGRSTTQQLEDLKRRKETLISLARASRQDMDDAIVTMARCLKFAAEQKAAAVAPEAKCTTKSGRAQNCVTHLTEAEFNHVPKYMKSNRITVQAVNKFIDDFNRAVAAKYTLLAIPKKELKTAELLKHQQYRRQEVPETKGLTFITENDVVPSMGRKMHDMAVILRHCGRIREVRGKGLVRFVVL